ncbi:DUF6807 family protein [Propioniciclava coleopterorum]|uniref:DUF6807 family protein n=1 Tax=Propioniciclava coleopterorum TaxID=2714937 RepID=UPI00197EF8C4|nr:DUF6807 family protein [Propioniciclava coleopterorum]
MSAPLWSEAGDGWELRRGEALLARCSPGSHLSPEHAPRPFLHPVRTLGGRDLTADAPVDHPHHHGLSFAVSSVNGTTFWGGRTYVRGVGSTMLANHGTQRVLAAELDGGVLRQRLAWRDPDGATLLTEERTLTARLTEAGWELGWDSDLTAATDLLVESSATKGRAGAGYGGIFWRFPVLPDAAVVTTADATGEDGVHGSTSPWLRVEDAGAWRVTLTRTGPTFPWFVRAAGYAGAGPALAFAAPLALAAGATVRLGLVADLADAPPTPAP